MMPAMTMDAVASFAILMPGSMRRIASARRPASWVFSTEPILTPAMRTSSPTLSSLRLSNPATSV
jgi:hypothetical protein